MYDIEQRHLRMQARVASEAPEIRHERLQRASRPTRVVMLHESDSGRGLVLPNSDLCTRVDDEHMAIFHTGTKPHMRHKLPAGNVGWGRVAYAGAEVLVTANENGTVFTWNTATGVVVGRYEVGKRRLYATATCNGHIVLADYNGYLVILSYSPDGSRLIHKCTLQATRRGTVFDLAAHGTVFAASGNYGLSVWDIRKRRCLAQLPLCDELLAFEDVYSIDIDDEYLVAASNQKGCQLRVYSRSENYLLLRTIVGAFTPDNFPPVLKLLSDDKVLVGGGAKDSIVSFVNIQSGAVLQRIRLPFIDVASFGVTTDARLIVASCHGAAILEIASHSELKRGMDKYALANYGKTLAIAPKRAPRIRKIVYIIATTLTTSVLCFFRNRRSRS